MRIFANSFDTSCAQRNQLNIASPPPPSASLVLYALCDALGFNWGYRTALVKGHGSEDGTFIIHNHKEPVRPPPAPPFAGYSVVSTYVVPLSWYVC